ncbi:STAS/SEC14 domain-containing protein [Mycolicibacterium austroafricanum]|uniref:STAS/SEC14 domain-containing protein n=1 Tax=Mycolicibacterium austroafricanum TaxID=39687 RepID=UPI000CF89DB3|nr:STAS/SEC14 domain-containing protein [Mycolicibacterium austroafricanum]PQP44672.1 STAS/SEC14 domain-containing protein [Mycolicibacterium austroafricanum]QZT59692.1 STAS/SEC14 domain-containing protein [Mycolicibacterium austroafricanum]
MIEILEDMPAGVTGFRVSGHVSGEELRDFGSTMETMLAGDEIRLVEVVSDDYQGFGPGGLVEDLKMGLGTLVRHHSGFRRVAVVADKDWIRHAMHALGWMVPGELKLFGIAELDEAKAWAAG